MYLYILQGEITDSHYMLNSSIFSKQMVSFSKQMVSYIQHFPISWKLSWTWMMKFEKHLYKDLKISIGKIIKAKETIYIDN